MFLAGVLLRGKLLYHREISANRLALKNGLYKVSFRTNVPVP